LQVQGFNPKKVQGGTDKLSSFVRGTRVYGFASRLGPQTSNELRDVGSECSLYGLSPNSSMRPSRVL
jgi:hypothetical protein